MKKTDGKYIFQWYGVPTIVMILLCVIFIMADIAALFAFCIVAWIVFMAFTPIILKKKLEKKALEKEKSFAQSGFIYQHKFTSHDGVFYIDVNGRLVVIWKYNPNQICTINPSFITDIRTNDGKTPMGTYGVSCEFRLQGKKMKIWTLRVSNGYLSMKDRKVLEGISKADTLCQLLNAAKVNAAGGNMGGQPMA